MKKLIISVALTSALFAASSVTPQQADENTKAVEITQEDINQQNKISDASIPETSDNVDAFFEKFAEENDIEYGVTKDKKTFYTGKAQINADVNNPEFAKAASIAYQRAILNLQKDYVRDVFGRTTTKRLNMIESDNSSNAREFEDLPKGGTLKQIWDKMLALSGATLDAGLKKLGVDGIEGLSIEQKKVLFSEKFITQSLTDAIGSMGGLVPIKTKIADRNGAYEIGVIAVRSQKTQQIAKDMSRKTASIIKGNGKPITQFLPKNKADFVKEYGIRLVYDENGMPVIISYGNWGYIPVKDNPRKTNRLEDLAKEQALTQADAAISEFVGINITLKDKKKTGEITKESIKKTTTLGSSDNGEITESDFTNVIDKQITDIRTISKINLRGIRKLKDWSYTDENGITYVGVVRFYSYDNVANANEAVKKPTANQPAKKTPAKAINRESSSVNSLDDF